MDWLKILQQNGGINSEVLQTFTCFSILRHAASAITRDFIFSG